MSQEAPASASTTQPSQPSGRPSGAPQGAGGPAIQRQMVNFAFFKLDPAFRRLNDHDKLQADYTALVAKLDKETPPSFTKRPAATGGEGGANLTDC